MSSTKIDGRTELTDDQFARVSSFVERELGIKMPYTKKIMLESRLQKRLRATGAPTFETYLSIAFDRNGKTMDGDIISADGEILHMVDAITTNKTDFFREKDHFDYLLTRLLPSERRRMEKGLPAASAGSRFYKPGSDP